MPAAGNPINSKLKNRLKSSSGAPPPLFHLPAATLARRRRAPIFPVSSYRWVFLHFRGEGAFITQPGQVLFPVGPPGGGGFSVFLENSKPAHRPLTPPRNGKANPRKIPGAGTLRGGGLGKLDWTGIWRVWRSGPNPGLPPWDPLKSLSFISHASHRQIDSN